MTIALPNSPTILFVSEYAGFLGGIEQYVFQTARWLRNAGYRLELLHHTTADEPERYLSVFHAASTDLKQLSPSYNLVMMHRIWDFAVAEEVMKRYGACVALTVHDHDLYCPRRYYYTPFGRTNCSRAYSPLRCGACGMVIAPRHWTNGFCNTLRRNFFDFKRRFKLARRVPQLVVLSDFMRNNLVRNGFQNEHITVLPPAIEIPEDVVMPDATRFKSTPPLIGFVGQLIRGKGADIYLEVLEKLKNRGADFQGVIVGKGPDEGMLKETIQVTGLNVKMVGFAMKPQEWYARCDLLLLPFRWQEPFGLVGAEAAANAVPVVAYDVGGVQSWMKSGETGLAVAFGDVMALADAVERLLKDAAYCARLGGKAREFAMEQFAPQRFLENYAELIDKIKHRDAGVNL